LTPFDRLAVAVETPQHAALGGVLDYRGPPGLAVGTLVRAPLGRRTVPGIVWPSRPALTVPEGQLRELVETFSALPPLPAPWLQLVEFAAGYYQRGVGELALSVLPPELRKLTAAQVDKRIARLLKMAPKAESPGATPPWPTPSEEQASVLQALGPAGTPILLHGATGSGKTEVYLHAAARALDAGHQVLVLVPEINLTPQLEARFAERFPGRLLVSLHSGLTPAQRREYREPGAQHEIGLTQVGK
jgi:primosomal protein N' (replication factor Y)